MSDIFVGSVYSGALQEHEITNVGQSRERTKQDHSSVMYVFWLYFLLASRSFSHCFSRTAADVTLSKAIFPDTVVWNPYPERAAQLGDLVPAEVCLSEKRWLSFDGVCLAFPIRVC